MTINKKHLQDMLDLQNSFNVKVNPEWRLANYPFVDAIWTEAGEAFNHTNWEWWKKKALPVDVAQIKMEVIDIWHFAMSELLNHDEVEDMTYVEMIVALNGAVGPQVISNPNLDKGIMQTALREMIASALMPREEHRIMFILSSFIKLMAAVNMDWEELYKLYLGKNALNGFRQANGYKTNCDEYKAKWAVEKAWEDNQYLSNFLEGLDVTQKDVTSLQESITNHLTELFTHLGKIYNED